MNKPIACSVVCGRNAPDKSIVLQKIEDAPGVALFVCQHGKPQNMICLGAEELLRLSCALLDLFIEITNMEGVENAEDEA